MKKLIFFVALHVTLLLISLNSFTQSTVLIRGDTVRLYKQGDSSYTKVDSFLFVTKQASIGYPYLPLSTSALLELNSTSMGFRTSRMTAAQRLAISSPGAANFVWDSDSLRFLGHNGTVWKGIAWTGEAGAGAGSTALSSITAAVAANTINSGNNEQEWQWNTLAGKNAFTFSSNSTAAAGNAQVLVRIALSGINANAGQTTSALVLTNDHAGTGAINSALSVGASNGATNYAIYSDPGLNHFEGEVELGTVPNDNAETKLMTWNSTTKRVKYRDVSSIGGAGLVDGDYGDITVGGSGTTMTYDFRRFMAIATVVATDADITAVAGTVYSLPAATLTQNRNIDMTNVNVNGDYIEFDNQEAGFTWTFTGQTVYDAMENPVTTLFGQLRYIIRRSNGKLKIIN